MATPPECQPLANQVGNLIAQEQTQFAALAGLTDAAKWKALEDLGTLRQQIADQQAQLTACLKQYGNDLATTVVVTDVRAVNAGNRIGRVWQLTSTGQAVSQTSSVDSGTVSFSGALNSVRDSIGITIEQIDRSTVNGPDFRSGPLPSPLTPNDPDPVERIEIVILDPMEITAETLTQVVPALPIQLAFPAGVAGTIGVSIATLNFVVQDGNVTLSAGGTASAAGATSQFTFGCTVHIAPTFSMAPSFAVDVLSGQTPTLTMSGIVGAAIESAASLVSSNLLEQVVPSLRSLLNTLLSKQVATKLGLPALPSGSVLSICELATSGSTITLTPALGAFGTVLSDFQPAPLAASAILSAVSVQPTAIGSINGTAQGTVSLFTVAPAGGATVALSSSRADLINLDPPSLTIPEGAASASFTIGTTAPAVMPGTPVDCTILASLRGQTVSATLSIQPQQSTDVTAPQDGPASGAYGAGIASLDINNPPIRVGQPASGSLSLNGYSVMTTAVTLRFSEPSILPFDVLVPAGFAQAFFNFTLKTVPSDGNLTITASSSAGDSRTVSVPVASA